jgi:hypothetical protein
MAGSAHHRSGSLPRIRGTQVGLRNPGLVDEIKAAMRAGRYAFQEPRSQIGGVLDPRGTYHVEEGHHRMAAGLELFAKTGEATFAQDLLRWGRWTRKQAPSNSRPMPARDWWGKLRNWLGF